MRQWLKDIRLEKGYTQEEVAYRSKVQRSYYTMIESGNRRPSVVVAKSIAKTLNFQWTIFFEEESNETLQNNPKQKQTI